MRWWLMLGLFALVAAAVAACSHRPTHGGTFQLIKSTPAPPLSATAAIARRSECDADATVVSSAQPAIPDIVRRPGHPVEWVVAVAVKLDAKGHVQHASVWKSYGETTQNQTVVRLALNVEALKAANIATYKPRVMHCKAVPSTYFYQMTFTGGP